MPKPSRRASRFADRFRVAKPKGFRLSQIDPADTWKLRSKEQAANLLQQGVQRLTELQEMLNAHERYLARNGTAIRKFFLHVSREEQKKRFLSRLDEPEKHWKFALSDVQERGHWDAYMHAYEDMIRHTTTEHAPWYVVPADNKWFTRLAVAAAVIDALEDLALEYPKVDSAKRRELATAREALADEGA